MKRIAAHIGITTFCALAVAFYLPETASVILLCGTGAAAVLLIAFKRTRKTVFLPAIAVTAALAIGTNLCYTALAVRPVTERFSGEAKRVEAMLTDEVYHSYNKYCYRLETVSIGGEPVKTKLLLKTSRPIDIEPFQKLRFTTNISPTENAYYKARGYWLSVNKTVLSCTVSDDGARPLYAYAIGLRQAMREAIHAYLPKSEAELCCAVLLGDKYALSQDVKDEFSYSGVSYYIVVSGMHFSILCTLAFALFKRLLRRRWLYFSMTYLLIFVYMAVTGFQPSVMRSGVMMLVFITGKLIRRQYDALTSLGIAGLMMPLIFSPYGCGDIGLILSFSATFAIILWATPIYEKLRVKRIGKNAFTKALIWLANLLLQILSVSLAANILVLPLSVWFFNGFSLMTLFASVLLYPLIWCMLPTILSVCVLHYLGPLRYIALLLSWLLYGLAKLILLIVHLLAAVPFAYVHVRAAYFSVWLGVTLLLGIAARYLPKKRRFSVFAVLLSAILLFGGYILHTVIQLQTDVLELYAGSKGAAVYLNRHGRLYVLRFDCDSVFTYKMLQQMLDDFPEASTAVCRSYRENVNYTKMNEYEFPVGNYLINPELPSAAFSPSYDLDDRSAAILDQGVILQTVKNKEKLMLYLTDGDRSLMLLPDGYAFDAIPPSMRTADIILLDQLGEGYEALTCTNLIWCNAVDVSGQDLPQNENSFTLSEEPLRIKLN